MVREAGDNIKAALSMDNKFLIIAKGILVAYLITIPTFLIFAYILSNTDFPEKYLTPAVLITTVISILVAGSTVTKNVRSKGWLNGAIVGLVYMTVLYLASSLVFRDFSVNRSMVMIVLIGVLTGIIGGIVGINLRRGSHSKRKK